MGRELIKAGGDKIVGDKANKLKYTPSTLCGILTSSVDSHKYNIFKELALEILGDKGCFIFAYNTEVDLIYSEKRIKDWSIDYSRFVKSGQIIPVSTDEYLKDGTIDIQHVYSYYCNLIDKCKEKGHEKILIYGTRNKFYEGKLTFEKSYEFHNAIKKIAMGKGVMILTNFFLDEFSEEYFYSLMYLYDKFLLYDSSKVYIYKPNSFTEIEVLFRYVKSIFTDRMLLHRENKKLELLNELILDSSYRNTTDDLLDTLLVKISEITSIDFGCIMKITDNFLVKENILGRYKLPPGYEEELDRHKLKLDEIVIFSNNRVTIQSSEDFEEPILNCIYKKYNIKTFVSIPIKSKNNSIIGIMFLFSSKDSKSIYEHIHFLEAVGSTLWALIQKQKLQEDYQKSISRTEKLKALGELAGGIAHDFNNLLTTILGFSQIALSQELSSDLKEYMNIIYKSALDGKNIVERILSFNRKQFNHKKDIYSINSIVESSIEMAKPRWKNYYESCGNSLVIIKELKSNSKILCVDHEIREVIINLLSNAMDAMECGGTLTIKTYDENNKAVIEIGDTGPGIPEEVREEIFEPYYSTKGAKGTGLGLCIVKEIVEEHNGIVEIESGSGCGTIFKLYFDGILRSTKSNNVVKAEMSIDVEKELKVLVIDDISQVGDTIVRMLSTLKVDADLEITSSDVMDRLLQKKYDIIICDLAMPDPNGIGLSKKVKAQYPDVKFIIITGWPSELMSKNYESVDYVLTKPCTLEDLAKAIKSVT